MSIHGQDRRRLRHTRPRHRHLARVHGLAYGRVVGEGGRVRVGGGVGGVQGGVGGEGHVAVGGVGQGVGDGGGAGERGQDGHGGDDRVHTRREEGVGGDGDVVAGGRGSGEVGEMLLLLLLFQGVGVALLGLLRMVVV